MGGYLMRVLIDRSRLFIEHYLFDQDFIRLCSAAVLFTCGIMVSNVITSKMQDNTIYTGMGADFAAFYIAGTIANSAPASMVYDLKLQKQQYYQLYSEAKPVNAGSTANSEPSYELPYLNAPFFILPFMQLAKLPYPTAYFSWTLISIGLFMAGLLLIRGSLEAMPKGYWPTATLLSFSFLPYMFYCLAGGQTSAFGFFCMALAFYCERKGLFFLSGAALALCLYKPPLLLLVLPMLLLTRRLTSLIGFVAVSLLLALVSLNIVGAQGLVNYMNILLYLSHHAVASISGLKSVMYVDINSFARLLTGGHSYARWGLILSIVGLTLPPLIRFWWYAKKSEPELVWGATIAWTLVLNIYLGIYDTTLMVLAALLASAFVFRQGNMVKQPLSTVFKYMLVLIYLVPWFTQLIAEVTRVQLFTLVILAFGLFLIFIYSVMHDGGVPSEVHE